MRCLRGGKVLFIGGEDGACYTSLARARRVSGPREREINLSNLCRASDRWRGREGGAVIACGAFTTETKATGWILQFPHCNSLKKIKLEEFRVIPEHARQWKRSMMHCFFFCLVQVKWHVGATTWNIYSNVCLNHTNDLFLLPQQSRDCLLCRKYTGFTFTCLLIKLNCIYWLSPCKPSLCSISLSRHQCTVEACISNADQTVVIELWWGVYSPNIYASCA